MPTVIMTIKPRHLRNIKSGIKRYELRKTKPGYRDAPHDPVRVLLCESGGRGEVVGEFKATFFADLTTTPAMELARLACITAAEADGYRRKGRGKLWGWLIKDFKDYRELHAVKHINDFGLDRPPQSWQYIKAPYADVRM